MVGYHLQSNLTLISTTLYQFQILSNGASKFYFIIFLFLRINWQCTILSKLSKGLCCSLTLLLLNQSIASRLKAFYNDILTSFKSETQLQHELLIILGGQCYRKLHPPNAWSREWISILRCCCAQSWPAIQFHQDRLVLIFLP